MSILHFSTQDIVYLRCPTQIQYAWMPLVLSIQIDNAFLHCFHILIMSIQRISLLQECSPHDDDKWAPSPLTAKNRKELFYKSIRYIIYTVIMFLGLESWNLNPYSSAVWLSKCESRHLIHGRHTQRKRSVCIDTLNPNSNVLSGPFFKEILHKRLSFTWGGADVLPMAPIVQILHRQACPELFSLCLYYMYTVQYVDIIWWPMNKRWVSFWPIAS